MRSVNCAKYMHGVKVLPVYGGQDINRQIKRIKRRCTDHYRYTGTCHGSSAQKNDPLRGMYNTIVLDEADEMLNMGFREDIETILEYIPEEGQTDGSVFCDHAKADFRHHKEISA